jgi:midasin (ATPase involved in ribosome maturation)
MGRRVAVFWHATSSLAAGVLYFFFVLPRWPELTGDTSHALGTAARIVAGVVIALAALPVVFTLLRSRKPEFGTPALALTLLTASIVAHVLAGVLIVGAAISEIWLNLDNVGQSLFGIYGAAAAIAVLGIFGFYLSSVAELPPPPPKPLKPKKDKKQRRRGTKDREADAAEETAESDEADEDAEETADTDDDAETTDNAGESAETAESPEVESSAAEPESTADEALAADDTEEAESSTGGLRNRRPTGKGSAVHRRRRSRRGVAVED